MSYGYSPAATFLNHSAGNSGSGVPGSLGCEIVHADMNDHHTTDDFLISASKLSTGL